MAEYKLKANIILEVLGRPPEHVTDALTKLIARLGTEKGVRVLSKTIHEPKPIENSQGLFTSFAEVMVELDSLNRYFGILFGYMPSHLELLEPEKVELSNFEFADLANVITTKLHGYDAIAKKMIADRDFLIKKLREVAPHLFKEQKNLEQEITGTSAGKSKKPKAKKPAKKSKKK
jgi:hypothetical protein